MTSRAAWPPLPYAEWRGTYETLHLMTQVVGKVRLSLTPWLNHSWHTPFYVSPRGLSTGVIHAPKRALELEFDLIDARLVIRSDAPPVSLPLGPTSIAGFYSHVRALLRDLGVRAHIHAAPNELPQAVPFRDDREQRPYEPTQARAFFRALLQADRVLKRFRTGFIGKSSPVHFFWGSFDLAVTRFSGRPAPPHPGGVPHLPDEVVREAYSHEVASAGFWPGGPGCEQAAFYAYAYPEPAGFAQAAVAPIEARYDPGLREFLLPYDAVAAAPSPDDMLMSFLQSAYEAAADLAAWDRTALECAFGEPGRPRRSDQPASAAISASRLRRFASTRTRS